MSLTARSESTLTLLTLVCAVACSIPKFDAQPGNGGSSGSSAGTDGTSGSAGSASGGSGATGGSNSAGSGGEDTGGAGTGGSDASGGSGAAAGEGASGGDGTAATGGSPNGGSSGTAGAAGAGSGGSDPSGGSGGAGAGGSGAGGSGGLAGEGGSNACDNGSLDPGETDSDCGGTECPRCENDKRCNLATDCESGFCNAKQRCAENGCTPPDGASNGSETGVDCGGPVCAACDDEDTCLEGRDCVSGFCLRETCTPCDAPTGCVCDYSAATDHEYRLCSEALPWENAEQGGGSEPSCASLGMHLVWVESASENSWLRQAASAAELDDMFWLGGRFDSDEDGFVWGDGTEFWDQQTEQIPGQFANWSAGSPVFFSDAYCVDAQADGSWSEEGCVGALPFVCEEW